MFYDLVKRLIDIAGAAILSVLFLPIWVIIPILLKIDSKGPIFYKPDRVGKNGQVFGMYKFRSMKMFEINGKVVHAVEFWKHNPELYEKYKKAGWKLELDEDPRITKLGKILRQTSIDETPQVINVLKGEMSLVGPRVWKQNNKTYQGKSLSQTWHYRTLAGIRPQRNSLEPARGHRCRLRKKTFHPL